MGRRRRGVLTISCQLLLHCIFPFPPDRTSLQPPRLLVLLRLEALYIWKGDDNRLEKFPFFLQRFPPLRFAIIFAHFSRSKYAHNSLRDYWQTVLSPVNTNSGNCSSPHFSSITICISWYFSSCFTLTSLLLDFDSFVFCVLSYLSAWIKSSKE